MDVFTLQQNGSLPYPSPGAAQSAQLATVMEILIPGFSTVSNLFMTYFKIDLSQYVIYLLTLVALYTGATYCFGHVQAFWNQYCISTAEIHYDDEMYNYLMFWISKQGLSSRTTHFVAGTQTDSSLIWLGEEEENDQNNPYDEEITSTDAEGPAFPNMKSLRYTPSTGTHFFRYKGRIIAFTRCQEAEQGFWTRRMTEQIYLSCLGHNSAVLKELLNEAQRTYLSRDGNKTIIYRGARGSGEEMEWVRCMSRPPRPLETVVLDEAQKQMVLDDMREYLHPATRHWYSNRGIPYRRGYLLYGPPGTGKTSLCFALAGLLRLRIYVVSLNSKSITEDSLAALFRSLPWRCIVLLEDIDSAGLATKRSDDTKEEEERTDDASKKDPANAPAAAAAATAAGSTEDNAAVNKALSLSGFLNIIDGVASAEGRILIMTTNYIEKLDPALLRPGRVDRNVCFSYANTAAIEGLYKAIYSNADRQLMADSAPATPASTLAPVSPAIQLNGQNLSTTTSLPKLNTKNLDEKRPGSSGSRLVPPTPSSPSFLQRHHGKSDEEISALSIRFAEAIPSEEFTPAEIQGFLLRHKMDPEGALDGASSWIEEQRAHKKTRSGK